MTSRERTNWPGVAIAAALMLGLPSVSDAQTLRGTAAAPYTPEPGATDLKSVIFNWAWHMGMLRSTEEYDLIMTLVYEGTGTMQVDGQPCNVTKYRSDISYQTSGERIRITGTRPNGQSCDTIQVLSGGYAWNEDQMGAGLLPGSGTATAMPNAVAERMIRLWAGPQGAWKSAMAGTSNPEPPDMTGRPQRVPADVMKAGDTSVEWVGGKPVVTFPIPGVPNAIATATLDDRFMAESVVVKYGNDTYEFTYSDYRDWNNPLHPAEAFYAGRMTEKKNGTVVRDITTTQTETGQVYVVVPVPPSVKLAMTPTFEPPKWTLRAGGGRGFGAGGAAGGGPGGRGGAGGAAGGRGGAGGAGGGGRGGRGGAGGGGQQQQAAAVETPRRADGKPDFTGSWGRAANPISGGGNRRCTPTQVKGGGINPEFGCTGGDDNFFVDYAWISPSRFGVLGRPIYKPEHWDRIQELDMWTNKYDPVMTCKPLGLPRHGTPTRIIQTDHDMIFFYPANADYGGGNNEFRDIPIDGRELTTQQLNLSTYYGQSVGHWEGDTLVIESVNFDDTTWLGRGGLIHSGSMRIVEKLRRDGNELHYDMTIEDPEMFVEPWVMPTRVLRLSGRQDTVISERANCEVYEEDNVTSQVRH